MKNLLALSLIVSVSFIAAKDSSKKVIESRSADIASSIAKHVQQANSTQEEAFDPVALDDALDLDPDALDSDDETSKPSTFNRYFTQPMTRMGVSTYSVLPDNVQLALLAAYIYAEESYETFSDFLQVRYRSFRGFKSIDSDELEEQDEETEDDLEDVEDSVEETEETDSGQEA